MDGLSEIEIAALVQGELANRGWQLAAEPSLFAPGESFAGCVLARVAQWAAEKAAPRDAALVRAALIYEYCLLLHAAVSRQGSRVQQQALEETYGYGFLIASRKLGDDARADEVTWVAVMKLWRAVAVTGRVKDPGSCLGYFAAILKNELNQEFRRQGRAVAHEEPLAAPDPHDEGGARDDGILDPGAPDPALAVQMMETRAEVWEVLSDCLKNRRREYILITNMVFGFNASEIARQVRATTQVVYNETHRAITHIKQHCAEVMKRLLLELSALRAESAGRA